MMRYTIAEPWSNQAAPAWPSRNAVEDRLSTITSPAATEPPNLAWPIYSNPIIMLL